MLHFYTKQLLIVSGRYFWALSAKSGNDPDGMHHLLTCYASPQVKTAEAFLSISSNCVCIQGGSKTETVWSSRPKRLYKKELQSEKYEVMGGSV